MLREWTKIVLLPYHSASPNFLFVRQVPCFSLSRCLLPAAGLSLTLLLAGCGRALPELPGFDAPAWRKDPFGCQSARAAQLPVLEKLRDKLYDARISDIDAVFGHPDEEELSEQSEKIYIYYTRSGAQCLPGHPRTATGRVLFRFGATGVLTEVTLPVANKQ